MEPWYRLVTPRKEVREGRSFNPDEFAIALEQVVAGSAPDDYKKPEQFFSRTCFTRALRDNSGLVLRRLAGKTENTAPVQTLVTQMGGGKTHMLTTLWHLANTGAAASALPGVGDLLSESGLTEAPKAKVAVFVGNAWDPQPGRETPWIDIARQLAGDAGVEVLGPSAMDAPPGTDTINRLIARVDGPVLLLFDELLNLFSRHRALAEPMHAFLHNIVRGFVGSNHRAAVISLPRSQVEMTEWDLNWQDKIVKVIGAVAKPLLVNDEAEISEVIRRRLFENLGPEKTQKIVARRLRRLVLRAAHNYRPNGPPSIPRLLKRRPKTFSKPALRRAIRSTRPHSRSFSGSGKRYPSSSRRAARSRCWPSGFPRRPRTATSGRGGNRSSPSVPRRSTCPSSAAWCWDNSANRGSWRP